MSPEANFGLVTPQMIEQLLLGSVPEEIKPVIQACLGDAPGDVRIANVKSLLTGAKPVRDALGNWITRILAVDVLVPEIYKKWRPLIRDGFQFLFAHLSADRLAAKLVGQVDLPLDTPPATRLFQLIGKMPGIQKLGQVIARHQNLENSLRKALSELENGMSDAKPDEIRAIVAKQLGTLLRKYDVHLDPQVFSEASVSAVVRFTWRNPETHERERGVFKVMKPYVRAYFAEDLALLQEMGEFLARNRGYGFATQHVGEMVAEVRLLLQHELDFEREQSTLEEAARTYRISPAIRVPKLIAPLSTPEITAMSEERGVKVTDVFAGKSYWRRRVAEQLVEALVTVPLLSRDSQVVFHVDPHAGNLLYDEVAGQIVLLDWALTERLNREFRRYVAMLVIMTVLRNASGVIDALRRLAVPSDRRSPEKMRLIEQQVNQYFKNLPYNRLAGSLDAMKLLDEIALAGVRFPAALAFFQKALFTLDGVLHDIAGEEVSISYLIVRDFAIRLLVSFGLDHPPLSVSDLLAVQKSGLLYPSRVGASALFAAGRVSPQLPRSKES